MKTFKLSTLVYDISKPLPFTQDTTIWVEEDGVKAELELVSYSIYQKDDELDRPWMVTCIYKEAT
jgi:hypothetical protein